MKKLKIVLGVLVGLFVVVTAVGFLLPSTMRVERSIIVNAPASSIYPLIANLKTGWTQWNPFGPDMDPDMKLVYSGPDEGVGATQAWDTPSSGDGKFTITKADRARGIEYDMVAMQESFRLHGSMLCEPAGEDTKVTWVDTMDVGGNPYRRYLGLFFEGELGDAFDKGLAKLKQKAEAAPKDGGEGQAKGP